MKQTDIPIWERYTLTIEVKIFSYWRKQATTLGRGKKIKCKLADYEWQSYSD